jgi:hypothetical protein
LAMYRYGAYRLENEASNWAFTIFTGGFNWLSTHLMVNLKRISVIRVSGFSSYTKFLSSRSDVNLLLKSIVFFSSDTFC